ncbi:MAG: hypothetical protein JXR76_30450 [Deltaproteobacteria bacterium]|nr:hypothetical protein [Deltaproteobacteria bacterium]
MFILAAQRFGFHSRSEMNVSLVQRTLAVLCLYLLPIGMGCTDRIAIDNSAGDSATATDAQRDTDSNGADSNASPDTGAHTDTGDDTDIGTYLHTYTLLYTWVADESEYTGIADTPLSTCSEESISTVSSDFALAAREQGTARLLDGRMINISTCDCANGFSCFAVIDDTFPWGMGSQNNALVPFVSLTADANQITFGTVVYSQQLDGITLPDNRVHDGCLRIDDVPTDPIGQVIHLFTGLNEYSEILASQIPLQVSVYLNAPRCNYL